MHNPWSILTRRQQIARSPCSSGVAMETLRTVLPTTPGWNYLVRLYCPRDEILNGKWKVPEAQVVK